MYATVRIATIAFVAFVLHAVWENTHVGLYTAYEGVSGVLPVTLWATLGDVSYTLLAIVFVSLCKNSFLWLQQPARYDYYALAVIGFWIALFVEYKAFAFAKWQYTAAMPLLPMFNVGLSPVLQMTVLLPLSVFVGVVLHRIGKAYF